MQLNMTGQAFGSSQGYQQPTGQTFIPGQNSQPMVQGFQGTQSTLPMAGGQHMRDESNMTTPTQRTMISPLLQNGNNNPQQNLDPSSTQNFQGHHPHTMSSSLPPNSNISSILDNIKNSLDQRGLDPTRGFVNEDANNASQSPNTHQHFEPLSRTDHPLTGFQDTTPAQPLIRKISNPPPPASRFLVVPPSPPPIRRRPESMSHEQQRRIPQTISQFESPHYVSPSGFVQEPIVSPAEPIASSQVQSQAQSNSALNDNIRSVAQPSANHERRPSSPPPFMMMAGDHISGSTREAQPVRESTVEQQPHVSKEDPPAITSHMVSEPVKPLSAKEIAPTPVIEVVSPTVHGSPDITPTASKPSQSGIQVDAPVVHSGHMVQEPILQKDVHSEQPTGPRNTTVPDVAHEGSRSQTPQPDVKPEGTVVQRNEVHPRVDNEPGVLSNETNVPIANDSRPDAKPILEERTPAIEHFDEKISVDPEGPVPERAREPEDDKPVMSSTSGPGMGWEPEFYYD